MPPISTLRDNFADNAQAPVWQLGGTSGSATAAETGGQAVFTLPSSAGAGPHEAYWKTQAVYDLTGDSFYITIGTMVATGVAATAYFRLYLDDTNYVQWTQSGGTLKAQKVVAGVVTDLYSVAWSSSTYKYLRIRESSGSILFDSSSNGTSWTNRATTTIASTFAVTALGVWFGASCANVASPGSFRLDDVNILLPALSTTWRWTEVEWPLLYRFKSVTLSGANGVGYMATSADGTTWRYFGGPAGSKASASMQLIEQSQANAETMAVDLPLDGRWDLPTIVECRFLRLYHRSKSGSYTLYEYYPRRLVQSDDIEAESIRAINIAAESITADHIAAALTITGKLIRTNISGARAVLSGDAFGGFIGYGSTDTYDPLTGTGSYQARWSRADGKIYAGGGDVVLDAQGLLLGPAADSLSTRLFLGGYGGVGAEFGTIYGNVPTADEFTVEIVAARQSQTASNEQIRLMLSTAGTSALELFQDAGTGPTFSAGLFAVSNAGDGSFSGSLSTNGSLSTLGPADIGVTDAATSAASTLLSLRHQSSGTPAAGFGTDLLFNLESTTSERAAGLIRAAWLTATDASRAARMRFFVYDTAARVALDLEASGSAAKIGFLGATAVTRPTVSGSRGGNAALASALTALANLGLITDSST